MADAPEWKEQSCGACGESKWRVRALESKLAGHGAYRDLALVCTGCGSVTHLVPRTFISAEWGREAEGEKDAGVLCALPWKRDPEGRPL